ncbi:MAG TPA: OB-fold domain-containing protein [Acidimicrobiia bacterium]|jgi:hypothetical protein
MNDATNTTEPPLRAPHAVAFSYVRSVGGAPEHFLRGLARAQIWASRLPDGRVVVPPVDHDPMTGASAEALLRVADTGTVRSWTWVADPSPDHPLPRPFAFALVQLDGADTSLLHAVDVDDESEMTIGLRVRADWRDSRTGSVRDLRAFVPESRETSLVAASDEPADVVVDADTPQRYVFEPGVVLSSFYRALGAGRIEGGRCPSCGKVYVPPRGRCPADGGGPMQAAALTDRGTVESFAVVHLPVPGMDLDLPYAWAWIRLDGADVPFAHLLGDVAADDVRVGTRVEAVWEQGPERPTSWEAIRHFRPVDES